MILPGGIRKLQAALLNAHTKVVFNINKVPRMNEIIRVFISQCREGLSPLCVGCQGTLGNKP